MIKVLQMVIPSPFKRIGIVIAGLISFCLGGGTLVPLSAQISSPPNIILIVTDDQRWDTLKDVIAESANPTGPDAGSIVPVNGGLGRLLNEGIEFTNAFVTTAVCCPSRSSFLTGLYTHNHGVLTNGGGSEPGGADTFRDNGNEDSNLAIWLQDKGYRTALIGKYLNHYSDNIFPAVPPGWSEWDVFEGAGPVRYFGYTLSEDGNPIAYGDTESDYSNTVLTQKSIDFIQDSVSGNHPFFLLFSTSAPHHPFDAYPGNSLTQTPGDENRFDGIEDWRPPSHNESDTTDKPQWVRDLPNLEVLANDPFNPRMTYGEIIDQDRKEQLETLLAVDKTIQSFFEVLNTQSQLDNTVIIFTSDNGFHWGEHRFNRKGSAYEESIRVPMLIWHPDYTNPLPGNPIQREEDVLNIDLAPTIAELANAPYPTVDGQSMLPLIDGGTGWVTRNEFLIEKWGVKVPPYAAIREATIMPPEDGPWKYVEYENGEKELYHLGNDPHELENKAYDLDPPYSTKIADMEARLQVLREFGTFFEGSPLIIATSSLPGGVQGTPYNPFYLNATGGDGLYSWEVVSGSLVEGLSLDSTTGLISGTPLRKGTNSFSIKVSDSRVDPEHWDTKNFTLTITGNPEIVRYGGNNKMNGPPSISYDGRHVALGSSATDLISGNPSGDTNGMPDIFVLDRDSDGNGIFDETTRTKIHRVSVNSDGTQANADSRLPSISANGRFVTFHSFAYNLVDDDTNFPSGDVFVHDRDPDENGIFDETENGRRGTTVRVSLNSNGEEANGHSYKSSISADGRHVSFVSEATNLDLVVSDTNGVIDAFVHDRDPDENGIFDEGNGKTVRVSLDSNGIQTIDEIKGRPFLNGNGRYVVYESLSDNLVPVDTNGTKDVFLHDRDPDGNGIFDEGNGTTTLISVSSSGVQGDNKSTKPFINGDGRHVVFMSSATNLVPGASNPFPPDIYVRDRDPDGNGVFDEGNGSTVRVSVHSSGALAFGDSRRPRISSDGRIVAFDSFANDLVDNDAGFWDVFIHDRDPDPDGNGIFYEGNGTTTRISINSNGEGGNELSFRPSISGNGRNVAFMSKANNLVVSDPTLGFYDLFIWSK